MTETCDLADRSCEPCGGGIPRMTAEEARDRMDRLHGDWSLNENATTITREFRFKGFAKAVYLGNLAAFIADREGHHPDICFGFGYCRISFTTHEIDGLSENDFISAAKIDRMTA